MLASILIIVFSVVLFTYWFRYSCILLLRNSVAPSVADPRFHFMQVQESLKNQVELDPLHSALQRDYQILSYLLQHAAGLELASMEDRILVLDYKVMQAWYRVTRAAAPAYARRALLEMSEVLGVLVHRISEQAGVRNEA